MTLKGVMTIELTDADTGAVETVTEENMITESVNNILGLNPMGIFYAATGEYDDAVLWNDNLLPICPNMIGGILLFSEALAEDEELLYESSDNLPVAYASNDVNSTANLASGVDQRPGRTECFWEPCGGRQRFPSVKGSGYRRDFGRQ